MMRSLVSALERRNQRIKKARCNETKYVSVGTHHEPWKVHVLYACTISLMMLISLFMCGHIQLV